ncbi:MAG: flagellar hook-basal body complex protein [Planctomycetes bacterium]|nr:flagellar hook-basal body complex protein [Planctomycetota bacterium]
MGLTSSLFAGLSGMKTNEFAMDVVGHNIANVNTRGFKSSRTSFQSQFSSTFSFGSAPTGTFGGTNPMQVGTGAMVGGVTKDFSGGSPETTGIKTDLAIQGQGLFIISRGDGSQVYSRDGSFQFNSENYLMNSDGFYLQGYSIDSNFNVVEGTMSKLRIPIGEVTTASATTQAGFAGNLNANGNVGSMRTQLASQAFTEGSGGPAATAATALTDLYDGTTQVFEEGNVIVLSEANKGGADLDVDTFTVAAGSDLGEYIAWLEDVLGISTSSGLPDLTGAGVPDPGVTLNVDGSINVVGNIGESNTLRLDSGAITLELGTAAGPLSGTVPFQFNATVAAATGESIRTSFRAFDTLGNPMDINLTMVMESKSTNGITWRYFAESADDTDFDRMLGTGTFLFDISGNYLEGSDLVISIDRADTGASTPQSITLDFSRLDGYAMPSAMSILSQDGFSAGTLQDYSIGQDGIIIGAFDNGLTRQLGQVVLATFRNYEGLVALSDNLFGTGPNSGSAIIKKPMELGSGSISSAALELSNVDLSREFINLIIASTGFSASSRVIQTSDQLLNELMMMTR